MSEETIDVNANPGMAQDSSPENTSGGTAQPEENDTVPMKNRLAEAQRKLQKEQSSKKEQEDGGNDETLAVIDAITQRAAQAALEQVRAEMAPQTMRMFLLQNPDAVGLVDEINNVRKEIPELASVDKLETVLEIVRARNMGGRLREADQMKTEVAKKQQEEAAQAAVTGAGSSANNEGEPDVAALIKGARTMRELEEISRKYGLRA